MTFGTWILRHGLVAFAAAFLAATFLVACFWWEVTLVGMGGATAMLVALTTWLITGIFLGCASLLGLLRPHSRRPALLSCILLLATAAAVVEAPTIGSFVHVLRNERAYLRRFEEARIALRETPPREVGGISLDRSEDPPVRAAFFLYAAHGDVNGLVYDPTHEVTRGEIAANWLYGARVHHAFGPWYWFGN